MFQSGHLSLSHFMAPERTSAIGIGFPEIILFKNLALQFCSTKLNRPCFNVSERPSIPQPFYGTRDREGGVIGIIYLFMTRVWLLSLQNLSLEFHSLKLIVWALFRCFRVVVYASAILWHQKQRLESAIGIIYDKRV